MFEGKKPLLRPRVFLDTDVYTLAQQRMRIVFDEFDTVIVSFSGGKDSTAVLNVALDVAHSDPRYARHLPLQVAFFDEEAIPYETEAYVRRVGQRPDVDLTWFCLPVLHRNACSRTYPYWWPWAPESEHVWCRPLPPEAVTTLDGFPIWPVEDRMSIPDMTGLLAPPHLGNVAILMGIRAQESLTRTRAVQRVSKGETHSWVISDSSGKTSGPNLRKIYPIYDWTTEDVWTAPALLGWDYNHSYDLLEMAGISAHQQRCSPAFGEEPIGKLYTFATCFPDVWEKMVARVPGVGAAYRYSTTELYAYRGRPSKPHGMAWKDFLSHYIVKHGYATDKVVHRVLDELRRHYRKTTDPVATKIKHPITGCSYDYLLTLAMRGDFKQRKQATAGLPYADDIPAMSKHWRKYADDLYESLASGTWHELDYPLQPPADPYALIPAQYRLETP